MTVVEHSPVTGLAPEDRTRLGRRAQLLAAASVTYNAAEAVIAIAAGAAAGSAALVGFGLDASPVGIALAAASLVIMPFLSWAQRRTGRVLQSSRTLSLRTARRRCCAPTCRRSCSAGSS